MDLDLPAVHTDLIDDEANELLALSEVELVDADCNTLSEVADPSATLVVGDELVPLRHQALLSFDELAVASVDIPAAPLGLGQVE